MTKNSDNDSLIIRGQELTLKYAWAELVDGDMSYMFKGDVKSVAAMTQTKLGIYDPLFYLGVVHHIRWLARNNRIPNKVYVNCNGMTFYVQDKGHLEITE